MKCLNTLYSRINTFLFHTQLISNPVVIMLNIKKDYTTYYYDMGVTYMSQIDKGPTPT